MMTDLKPCPFCGGTKLNTSHVNEIWCRSCDAGVHLGDHGDNTSQFAVDSWNRRPNMRDTCKKIAYDKCFDMYNKLYMDTYMNNYGWKAIHILDSELPTSFMVFLIQKWKHFESVTENKESPILLRKEVKYHRFDMKKVLIEFDKWINNEFK